VMELVCDASKAKQMIGWEPEYELDAGLKETISSIAKNINAYKPDIYNL